MIEGIEIHYYADMDTSNYLIAIKRYWWQIGLVMVGLTLMGGGFFLSQSGHESAAVEIIEAVEEVPEAQVAEVMVDVSGAVMSPGLYRVGLQTRVGEAIAQAGGLSDVADYAQVAKSINLAQVVTDGMKIYVPVVGEKSVVALEGTVLGGSIRVSINRATAAELEELWGVGTARSAAIIANRPYESIDELITKAGIPASVVEKNQDMWEL